MLHPEQSLAGLTVALEAGRLGALTPAEVASLVRALYYEGEPRARFLALLAAVTGGATTESGGAHRSRLQRLADKGTGHAARVSSGALSFASSALSSIKKHGAHVVAETKRQLRDANQLQR
jgi:hypothetical protein